jgi:hypothetical protein
MVKDRKEIIPRRILSGISTGGTKYKIVAFVLV